MAISKEVQFQLFKQPTMGNPAEQPKAIRIPVTRDGGRFMQHPDLERFGGSNTSNSSGTGSARGIWTVQEHQRFLEALDKFPSGPWKLIAGYVGTKTPRQAMTHGQKYRQKIARRRRGLKKVVRDLQFDPPQGGKQTNGGGNDDATGRLSIESNPTGLSQEEFVEFIAELELAQELEHDVNPPAEDEESPLVAPDSVLLSDMGDLYLGVPDNTEQALPVTMTAGAELLPHMTTQQDVHHWAAMTRADASSEEFSAALAAAFRSSESGASPQHMAWPDKLIVFCHLDPHDATVDATTEPPPLYPAISNPDDMELDGFELQ